MAIAIFKTRRTYAGHRSGVHDPENPKPKALLGFTNRDYIISARKCEICMSILYHIVSFQSNFPSNFSL